MEDDLWAVILMSDKSGTSMWASESPFRKQL